MCSSDQLQYRYKVVNIFDSDSYCGVDYRREINRSNSEEVSAHMAYGPQGRYDKSINSGKIRIFERNIRK